MPSKLTRRFYQQDTETVARQLLGQRLVHQVGAVRFSGTIIETEAYLGLEDPACHSFHGKVTDRTRIMYMNGGHSYVYLIYGMHHCFNIVTRNEKYPEAVLIRALRPEEGTEQMFQNRRKARREKDLCSGPGKLCQAMGITKSENGLDLLGERLFVEKITGDEFEVEAGPRIGIDYAGEAVKWPLRFCRRESISN